jgi:hypothetical protein
LDVIPRRKGGTLKGEAKEGNDEEDHEEDHQEDESDGGEEVVPEAGISAEDKAAPRPQEPAAQQQEISQ